MAFLKIANNLTVNAPYSYLTNKIVSGASTIPVDNINQFTVNYAIQIGQTGEERSEILTPGTVSGTSLVTAATARFDHPTDTPVYSIKFDQAIFKRSTSGTSGTATALTDGTINITPDSTFTQFDDQTSAAGYAYKVQYRNSTTGSVSEESDWIVIGGYAMYQLGRLRQRMTDKLQSAGFIKDPQTINDWINEWGEEMNNAVVKVNKDYSIGTVDVSIGSDGLGTITDLTYKDIRRIWITQDGTNFFPATKRDINRIYPNTTYNQTIPYYSWRGDNVFEISPNQAGTARLLFYTLFTEMTNDDDLLPVSMRGYTNSFVNYALAQAYYLDSQDQKGDRFLSFANSSKSTFVSEITPRAETGVVSLDIVDEVSPNDDLWL